MANKKFFMNQAQYKRNSVIGDKLITYMRKYEGTIISNIAKMTCDAVVSTGKYNIK